jgi:hypothetical protein
MAPGQVDGNAGIFSAGLLSQPPTFRAKEDAKSGVEP